MTEEKWETNGKTFYFTPTEIVLNPIGVLVLKEGEDHADFWTSWLDSRHFLSVGVDRGVNLSNKMKTIPSQPTVVIRATRNDGTTHIYLEDYDGQSAILTRISDSCGPDGGLHCEVTCQDGKFWTCSSSFLEFPINGPCHYRDEAWERGQFSKDPILP